MTSTENPYSEDSKVHTIQITLIRILSIICLCFALVVQVLNGTNFPAILKSVVAIVYAIFALLTAAIIHNNKQFLSMVRPEIIIQNVVLIWVYVVCTGGLYALYYSAKYWGHSREFVSEKWLEMIDSNLTSNSEFSSCMRCSKVISTDAKTCPHCNYSPEEAMKSQASSNIEWAIALAITVLGLVFVIPVWNRGKRDRRIVQQWELRPVNTDPEVVPSSSSSYL